MTLNGVMAVTLRYFTEFGKPAFQHMTASARIELRPTDHKSAITHRAVKFVCVTKCKDYNDRPLLTLIYRLSFALPLPGLWSWSRRLGLETVSRRTNVSSRSRLEKKLSTSWSRLGLGRQTSRSRLGLGQLRLVLKTNFRPNCACHINKTYAV